MNRRTLEQLINAIAVVLVIAGLVIMFNFNPEGNELVSHGVENFKYFTVLSNVFWGLVAFSQLSFDILSVVSDKKIEGLESRFRTAKLIATTAVGLTFFTIAFFLWPVYKLPGMYIGSNLFFHLIVPLLAMVDFVLLEGEEKIPFKVTFIAIIPTFLYACFYLANILINGVGKWPDTNDWYGYLNWGYIGGAVIFVLTILVTWLMACMLRWVSNILNKSN